MEPSESRAAVALIFGGMDLPLIGERPERRDAAENRQRILRAARDLLTEDGPDGLTMDALAARAGVGKGTIFRRFGDRTGVTRALLDDEMREFQDAFLRGDPPLGPGAPPIERLRAFVIGLLRLNADHLPLALASQEAPGAESGPVYGALALHIAHLVEEIDPSLDGLVIAALILGTVTPATIDHALAVAGGDRATVERSTLLLLAGLVADR